MAMPAGKSTYDFVCTVQPSGPVGELPVTVNGVDLAGNLGVGAVPVALEILPPPARVPLAIWSATLGQALAGTVALRRRT